MFRIFALLFGLFVLSVDPTAAQVTAQMPLKLPRAAAHKLPPQAPAPAVTKVRRIFSISRNGSQIGTDIIEVDTQGDTTTVTFNTHIAVEIMFIQAYAYDHRATEVWTKGHFVSFKSATNDNGTKHRVTATVVGKKLILIADGHKRVLPQVVVPASLWNDDFIGCTKMFDTETGALLSIKVQDLGKATIIQQGIKVKTHHYEITGDLKRDLWLEGDVPVRMKFYGSDHSTIISNLRRETSN